VGGRSWAKHRALGLKWAETKTTQGAESGRLTLVTKQEHLMLEQGVVQLGELDRAEGLGEIDSVHFGD
jgi:hypothetical protein